jgi:hypothetical protein
MGSRSGCSRPCPRGLEIFAGAAWGEALAQALLASPCSA